MPCAIFVFETLGFPSSAECAPKQLLSRLIVVGMFRGGIVDILVQGVLTNNHNWSGFQIQGPRLTGYNRVVQIKHLKNQRNTGIHPEPEAFRGPEPTFDLNGCLRPIACTCELYTWPTPMKLVYWMPSISPPILVCQFKFSDRMPTSIWTPWYFPIHPFNPPPFVYFAFFATPFSGQAPWFF